MSNSPHDAPDPNLLNRTAMAKEALDRLKQDWLSAGLRLGEAERELARADKAVAHHAEKLKAFEASLFRKICLGAVGRLAVTRQTLRDELARTEERRRLAAEALEKAKANKELLLDTIAELERGVKKPRLCENRLTDFREKYV